MPSISGPARLSLAAGSVAESVPEHAPAESISALTTGPARLMPAVGAEWSIPWQHLRPSELVPSGLDSPDIPWLVESIG